jgi:hypothetical protein
MTSTIRSFSLLFLLGLSACSQTVVPEAKDPPKTDLCASLYDAYATWAKACTGAELQEGQRYNLITHCAARAALPGVHVADEAFQGCAAKIAMSSCGALPVECLSPDYMDARGWLTDVWLGNETFGTYEIFPRTAGKLAAGAGCDINAQCQSGECTADSDRCGICVDLKKPGEACGATTICTGQSSCEDGVCKEFGVGEGSPCEAPKGASNCKSSFYCPNGTCVPRLKVGDACNQDGLPFDACPVGAVCHDSICQTIHEAHDGQACNDSTAPCADEGSFCADGMCRKPVADMPEGSDCGPDACARGLACHYGHCAKAAQAGEECTLDVSCAVNLYCHQAPGGNRCGPLGAESEACGSFDECGPDLECDLSASTCTRAHGAGEKCGNGYRCMDPLECVAGVCSALGVCSTL